MLRKKIIQCSACQVRGVECGEEDDPLKWNVFTGHSKYWAYVLLDKCF